MVTINMKRFIISAFFAIVGIYTVSAQNLQNEILRGNLNTNLSEYCKLCDSISKHIRAIQESFAILSEKSDNAKIISLMKQINAQIPRIYDGAQKLDGKIKELMDSMQIITPQTAPKNEERVMPEQPPVGGIRDVRNSERQPPVERPVEPTNRRNDIENFLASFSLRGFSTKDELNSKRKEVKKRLENIGDYVLRDEYEAIFDLLEIQYSIYNRNLVRDVLQKTSKIPQDHLSSAHYAELQSEIERVKEYRYATMELQRLIDIVSNPPSQIKNAIGYGGAGAQDAKWAEEVEIPVAAIKKYLEDNKETEYINKFNYTREEFDNFVKGDQNMRQTIKQRISGALK